MQFQSSSDPSEAQSRPGEVGRSWLRAEEKRARRASWPVVAMGFAATLAAIGQAACAAWALDAALSGRGAKMEALAGFAVLALLRAGFSVLADRAAFDAGAAARRRLRSDALTRLLEAGPALLRLRHSAELASIVVDRIEALEGFFVRWMPASALAIAGPLAVVAVVLAVDPVAAAILLGAGLLVPAAMALAGLGAAAASRRQFAALTRLQTRFLDRISGIATIVLAGRAEDEARALAVAADELRRRTMRVLRMAFLSSAALDCAMALALVVLALRYGAQLRQGTLTQPGSALLVLLLVPEFFAPLRGFSAVYQDRIHAAAGADVLAALPPRVAAEPLAAVRNVAAHGVSVAFEDVRLTWDQARGPALDGLSFRLPAGQTLVLAGPSGAGKSTVIEILLGFVRPDGGRVTLNGADIASIVPQALSRLTAWIGQRPMLFAGIDSRQHPLRPAGGDRRRDRGRRPLRPHRQLCRRLAAGARHADRRGRLRPFRRSGAADRHRSRLPEERAVAAAGRADRASRSRHRGRGARQPAPPDPRPHRHPGQPRRRRACVRRPKAGPSPRTRGVKPAAALLRILSLWRGRAFWLAAGVVVSLAALAAGVALTTLSGALLAGGAVALAVPAALRMLGPARVVLRYLERLTTHDATFRALADLRVWFFRGLAVRAAGGLGFRRAGDVLSRLVHDVEALDGLYLRILVPLAGAVLLLPALAWLIGRVVTGARGRGGGAVCGFRFRAALGCRTRDARQRRAVGGGDVGTAGRRARQPDRPARGARVRRRGSHAGERAGARGGIAGSPARARRSHGAGPPRPPSCAGRRRSWRCCSPSAGCRSVRPAWRSRSWPLPRSKRSAGLPRAGVLAGHAAAAAARVIEAAEGAHDLPDPTDAGATAGEQRAAFRGVALQLAAGPPAGVRRPDARHPRGQPGRVASGRPAPANPPWRRWR